MKVKFLGESDPMILINGKIYTVESFEKGLYRIIDETNEDYLYDPSYFEILEGSIDEIPHHYPEELERKYLQKIVKSKYKNLVFKKLKVEFRESASTAG